MLLSQSSTGIGTFGGTGLGPLVDTATLLSTPSGPLTQFEKILSVTIGVLTVVGGIWFIFQIFSGTFQWLTSGGEKQALQNAQKRLTNAVIGLGTVVLAYLFIALIGKIFGFDILNPQAIIFTYLKP